MIVLRSSSTLNTEAHGEETNKNYEPLIPGLPDEIAELCLLYLPYPYQALVRPVSSSWKKAITDASFLISKKALSLSLPYIFVLAFHESTTRIQWQALDPRSGRWFVLPHMPCTEAVFPSGFECASLPHQRKLFVLGGMRTGPKTTVQTAIMYCTSTNQWSTLSPMEKGRSVFAAGSIKGKFIAVGGSGSSTTDSFTEVESYDPESDTWTAVAPLDKTLARHDIAVVGNKMYLTEGWTWPFRFSPRGGVYNPDEDTWRAMSKGMREGWSGFSVVLDDRLFVVSEYGDCPIKVYVPDEDTWQYVGGEKFPREVMKRPFAVNGVEGRIYVLSSGLNLAIGRILEAEKGEFKAEWEVMAAPATFHGFSPLSCQSRMVAPILNSEVAGTEPEKLPVLSREIAGTKLDGTKLRQPAPGTCPYCGGMIHAMDVATSWRFCFLPLYYKTKRKYYWTACARRLVVQ